MEERRPAADTTTVMFGTRWYLQPYFFVAVLDPYLWNVLQMGKWKHVVNHFQTWDRTRGLGSQLCPSSAAPISPLARSIASIEAKCRSI